MNAGDAGGGTAGKDGAAPAPDGTGSVPEGGLGAQEPADPGRVKMHRLTNVEYDNTVKDLLGVPSSPAVSFTGEALTDGFDNLDESLRMTPGRYLQYLESAKALAEVVWNDPKLRLRIVTCSDDGAGKCARSIIKAFGLRAWRRPLTDAEVASAGAFYDAARAETADHDAALKRTVAMMLSSLPFLHKIEIEPDPTSMAPRPLSGYELASRLSYLLWSSMPDDELLGKGAALGKPDVLSAQLDRMLDSPKADGFVRGFAGHWLGVRDLALHRVDSAVFTTWSAALIPSMTTEIYLYFADFRDRPMTSFLTDSLHFVDAPLAGHYRLDHVAADAGAVRVAGTTDKAGFLGLAGFLTMTSPPNRTSPSTRGRWIRERLLCDPPGTHPAGINPRLDLDAAANVRKVLEQSLLQASCRDCHATFDGPGFALEHFDGVGRLRDTYSPSEPIDAKGTLGAATFDGAAELGSVLAQDPRFAACATRKALTYALGRVLDDGDRDRVAALGASWKQGSIRELLHAVVGSNAFRFSRGEAP